MRPFFTVLLGSLLACGSPDVGLEDSGLEEDSGTRGDAWTPEPPDTSACPDGSAPPITECIGGYHYADCGGDAESSA